MTTQTADDPAPACPICGKPAHDRRLRPFCSRRCADVDLGRWLTGSYRVPSPEPAGEDELP
ncbi:MAG: DNA gyrase inhibitor YacG [Acetobacteraceae bacterium]|nr:DNA gyrase inhibitor YacG [Acetobacteraceae bacterium]